MKKIINTLLASTMLLSMVTSSFAQEIAPQEEVLQEITQETLSTWTYNLIYSLYQYRVSSLTSSNADLNDMRSVTLMDINGDGVEELILDYRPRDVYESATIQIWSYDASAQKVNLIGEHNYYCGHYALPLSIGYMPDGTYFYKEDNQHQGGASSSEYTLIKKMDGTLLDNLDHTKYYDMYTYEYTDEIFFQNNQEISQSQHDSRLAYWESLCKVTLEYGRDDLGGTWYTTKVPTGATTSTSICGFSDVKPSDWQGLYVQFVVENGFMTKGYTSSSFNPDGWATRGMVAEALFQMITSTPYSDYPYQAGREGNFPDAIGTLFEYELGYCKDIGFLSGYPDGTVGLNDPITREAFVTSLPFYPGNAAGYSVHFPSKSGDTSLLNQFSDNDQISSWAKDAMSWAVANGLMNGSDGKINPQGSLSRAEMAVIVKKCAELFQFSRIY